ncbi:MAG: hypothetical protein R6U32_05315 [Candidatus Woesearchaeota archaeon]
MANGRKARVYQDPEKFLDDILKSALGDKPSSKDKNAVLNLVLHKEHGIDISDEEREELLRKFRPDENELKENPERPGQGEGLDYICESEGSEDGLSGNQSHYERQGEQQKTYNRSSRPLVGILLTEEGNRLPSEERENYLILKELGDEYRDKTFQEIAEYLAEDEGERTTKQQETANRTKSCLERHKESSSPEEFICYFIAYKEQEDGDITPIKCPDGKEDLKPDYAVQPYIDSRELPSGEEYDCIDIVVGGIHGC